MSDRMLCARADAAYRLAISLRKLDTLISAKKIRVVKIGRRTLIPVTELNRFASRGTRSGGAI